MYTTIADNLIKIGNIDNGNDDNIIEAGTRPNFGWSEDWVWISYKLK